MQNRSEGELDTKAKDEASKEVNLTATCVRQAGNMSIAQVKLGQCKIVCPLKRVAEGWGGLADASSHNVSGDRTELVREVQIDDNQICLTVEHDSRRESLHYVAEEQGGCRHLEGGCLHDGAPQ